MVLTQTLPGWEPSARRLVEILIAGSSSTPSAFPLHLARGKKNEAGALVLKTE